MVLVRRGGFSTLLVTSLLLGATFVLVLALYKNVFFHIKQIQNELSYRSSVWQAESGLECMFADIKTTHNPWSSPSFCEPITGNQLSLEELGDSHFRLHSISGHVSLSRELVLVSVQGEVIKVSWWAGTWYEH